MHENELKQRFLELIEAQGEALAMVVAAMSAQMDVERLATDLRSRIAAAKLTGLASALAMRIATHALAAADAESALRRKGTH